MGIRGLFYFKIKRWGDKMSKKVYDFIQVGILVLFGISFFVLYPLSGISIFKYIGVSSLILASIFPIYYYLRNGRLYFDGEVYEGKKAFLVIIFYLAIVVILFIVFIF
jgi:hypothetical protein